MSILSEARLPKTEKKASTINPDLETNKIPMRLWNGTK